MGVASICSSRAITARPLASWPVTTWRTRIPCLLLVRLVHGHVPPPALGCNPGVERRHIKLWISSAEVLETLLNSSQRQRGEAMLAEWPAGTPMRAHRRL